MLENAIRIIPQPPQIAEPPDHGGSSAARKKDVLTQDVLERLSSVN